MKAMTARWLPAAWQERDLGLEPAAGRLVRQPQMEY
jgi:hypothetical protein